MDHKERLEELGIKDPDIQTNEYLKHFGILGMKWGIRRYQPYPKGEGHKGRYTGKKNNIEKIKTKKSKKKEDKQQKKELKKNPVSPAKSMSDDELRQLINRLNMERQYDKLTTAEKTKGQKMADEVLTNAAKQIATRFVMDRVEKVIKGK